MSTEIKRWRGYNVDRVEEAIAILLEQKRDNRDLVKKIADGKRVTLEMVTAAVAETDDTIDDAIKTLRQIKVE